MKRLNAVLFLALCLLLLSACESRSTLTGRYLKAENGASLIVTEAGEPLSLSDQSRGKALFDGLDSGDLIEIPHDAIAETFPGQAGVYSCKLLENGGSEHIPEEAIAVLEEMGYSFDFHRHAPAEEPLTVESPVSGYCGNIITEIVIGKEVYSFWGSDSVTLTDILINLAYDPEQVCRCLPEFTVNTELGSGYGVNLSESYARCEGGQAALTVEQVTAIREILDRNCTN